MEVAALCEAQIVADILKRWPSGATAFVARRMACPGCDLATFETLGEAAANYGLPVAELLAEIAHAVAGAPSEG